jgi:hypothetical protein
MHGESHYRPWEILEMTEAEIVAALDSDLSKRRPPQGSVTFHSDAERRAWMERRIAETPRELLARLRER